MKIFNCNICIAKVIAIILSFNLLIIENSKQTDENIKKLNK